MKLLWTRDAAEADNPRAAIELDEQFSRRASQLISHPMAGRAGRVPSTRELVVRPNYILIYDMDGETIRILRVLHAAQQWPPPKAEQ